MRKPISFLFVFSFLLLAACNRKDDTPPFSYIIDNVQSVPLSIGGTNTLPLEIKYVSGNQEPVNLAATGLPAGVTASFSAASATPTFSSVLTLTASTTAAEGTYPIKITSTSASTGTKSYDLELVIKGFEMNSHFLGTWNLTATGEDLNKDGVLDSGEVTPPPGPCTMNFSSNGEGVMSYSTLLQGFTWSVSNNQKTLIQNLWGTDVEYLIHTVTTDSVLLRNEDGMRFYWTVLVR